MRPRKSTYLLHRWLGLIVSLQLLAWSIGGFTFSILALDNVRGERDIASPPFEPLSPSALQALPEQISSAILALPDGAPDASHIALVDRGVGPAWEIRGYDEKPDGTFEEKLIARLDPGTGRNLPILSRSQAELIAQRDFTGSPSVSSTTLIESDRPVEYRKGPLPVYRVELDHAKAPHLYIDARTGEVVSRRNRVWRIFDFFWMLHTMDYQGRDNFNHLLLTAFSILAILTSASGLTLWGWRACSKLRSHHRKAAQAKLTADTPAPDIPIA